MELNVGTQVASGRYVVESVLGSGGMAVVYKVTHRDLGTPLALKVLPTAPDPERVDSSSSR